MSFGKKEEGRVGETVVRKRNKGKCMMAVFMEGRRASGRDRK